MYKLVCLAVLVAVANAGVVPSPAYSYGGPVRAVAGPAYAAPAYAAAPAFAHAPAYAGHGFAGHGYAAPAFRAAPVARVAAPLAYAAPVAKVAAPAFAYAAPAVAKVAVPEEYDPHPQYSYSYSVADGLTGDSKGHTESRDGDVVQGQYTVADPDGTIRTVSYTADPIHGFNAVIDRQAAVAKVAAPVAVAKVAAPVAYAAPAFHAAPAVAKVGFAGPAYGAYGGYGHGYGAIGHGHAFKAY